MLDAFINIGLSSWDERGVGVVLGARGEGSLGPMGHSSWDTLQMPLPSTSLHEILPVLQVPLWKHLL